jgi:SAM-dependent methyltransferase
MKEYIEINRNAYDELSQDYEARARQRAIKMSEFEHGAEFMAGPILKLGKLHFPTVSVLEIGPGSGEICAYFEKNDCRTIAVELSPKMAKIMKKRSPNTILLLGDILELEFYPKQFEIVYASALIHLFPINDALQLLTRIHKWLKPEGLLYINTTIHSIVEERCEEKVDYNTKIKRFRRKWKEEDFLSALEDNKFQILDRRVTDEKDRWKIWVEYICKKKCEQRPTD